MSTKEFYHLTSTSAHLSNAKEEGNTDIDKATRPTNGPNFVRNDAGIPPRTPTFTATITRHTAAAASTPPSKEPHVLLGDYYR